MITSRITRTVVTAAALLAPVAVPAWQGAATAVDAGLVVGTWQQAPGLPLTGCAFQDVRFLGVMDLAGNHTGAHPFELRGASAICESLGAGQGSAFLNGGITGNVSYSRTGTSMAMAGAVTVGGTTTFISIADCHLAPVSAGFPVTTFALQCAIVLQ